MSGSSNKPAEEIVREREIRRSGNHSRVLTIPPIFFEFTEFSETSEVELEADIGDDEIVLRPVNSGGDAHGSTDNE